MSPVLPECLSPGSEHWPGWCDLGVTPRSYPLAGKWEAAAASLTG